jgi:dipeptidyl aminopeptidase/acylaminoacyl peptidase
LDDGFLREDSVKDIGSLLDWVNTQQDLDSDKICVDGGSYGGYMVTRIFLENSQKNKMIDFF